MILEGLITTLNDDGTVNLSPMGPHVDDDSLDRPFEQLLLKPYQTSTTYQNLKRTGQAVFHVTDDVELIARAAVGAPDPMPPMQPAQGVEGQILGNACRWLALRVRSLDDRQPRTEILCDVVAQGRLRDFFGFNRGKHAVLEGAILATRVEFLPADEILSQFESLRLLVDKTGGPAEQRAFQFLHDFVQSRCAAKQK